MGGKGKWELFFHGYRVSVPKDEKGIEIDLPSDLLAFMMGAHHFLKAYCCIVMICTCVRFLSYILFFILEENIP